MLPTICEPSSGSLWHTCRQTASCGSLPENPCCISEKLHLDRAGGCHCQQVILQPACRHSLRPGREPSSKLLTPRLWTHHQGTRKTPVVAPTLHAKPPSLRMACTRWDASNPSWCPASCHALSVAHACVQGMLNMLPLGSSQMKIAARPCLCMLQLAFAATARVTAWFGSCRLAWT